MQKQLKKESWVIPTSLRLTWLWLWPGRLLLCKTFWDNDVCIVKLFSLYQKNVMPIELSHQWYCTCIVVFSLQQNYVSVGVVFFFFNRLMNCWNYFLIVHKICTCTSCLLLLNWIITCNSCLLFVNNLSSNALRL